MLNNIISFLYRSRSKMFHCWQSHLFIASLALSILTVTAYSLYYAQQKTTHHEQMIHAIHEVMLKSSAAHLYLEEFIAGDSEFGDKEIWKNIDKAKWYVKALLHGDEDEESIFYPIRDPIIRQELLTIDTHLDIVQQSIVRMINVPDDEIPTERDLHTDDEAFAQLMKNANKLEAIVLNHIKSDKSTFNGNQSMIIGLTVLFVLAVGFSFQRYEKRQNLNFDAMAKAKADLEKNNSMLRQSESLYRSLVENIDLGITLIDNQNNILMTNPAQGKCLTSLTSNLLARSAFKSLKNVKKLALIVLAPEH